MEYNSFPPPTYQHVCSVDKSSKDSPEKSSVSNVESTHAGAWSPKRPFLCDHRGCGKSYYCKAHLVRHQSSCHSFVCSVKNCTKTFVMSSHTESKKYHCSENGCEEVFNKKHQLYAHRLEHKTVLPFQCDFEGCRKQFSKMSRLLVHERTHTGERPFVCDHEGCEKSYARKAHLVRHQSSCHREKTHHTFVCGVKNCTKTFASKCGLDKHAISVHTVPSKYYCSESGCDKAFHKKHQLRVHSFEHKGVLPFQCDFEGCNKQFKQTSHLLAHKQFHNPYVCDVEGCAEVFTRWSNLRAHKALEHKRKFKCDICQKTFQKPGQLANHTKLHDSSKMLKCPYDDCSRTYSELRNLKAHIRSYHEGQKVKCNECGKELVNRSKLRSHLKWHEQSDSSVKKSYPRKGHRRKPASIKVINGVMNTHSPMLDIEFKVNEPPKNINQAMEQSDTITGKELKCQMELHRSDNTAIVQLDRKACVEALETSRSDISLQNADSECGELSEAVSGMNELFEKDVCCGEKVCAETNNISDDITHVSDCKEYDTNTRSTMTSNRLLQCDLLDPVACRDQIVSVVPLNCYRTEVVESL